MRRSHLLTPVSMTSLVIITVLLTMWFLCAQPLHKIVVIYYPTVKYGTQVDQLSRSLAWPLTPSATDAHACGY